MKLLLVAVSEIAGLFVDDGLLAVAAVLMLGFAGLLIKVAGAPPLATGGLLVVGCIGALYLSVRRATRAAPRDGHNSKT